MRVFFILARNKAFAFRRHIDGAFLHRLLEEHVKEQIHGLGLDDERARRLVLGRVEMLVHAIIVHDGDVARLPVIANAVVNFVAFAVENVESCLVHMAVLLRRSAGRIFFQMHVEGLRDAVLGLDVMA